MRVGSQDGNDRWGGTAGAPPCRPSPTEEALLQQLAELQAQLAEQDKKLATQEARLADQAARLAAQDERAQQLSSVLLLLARGCPTLKDTDPDGARRAARPERRGGRLPEVT
jgi:hypothetical protein